MNVQRLLTGLAALALAAPGVAQQAGAADGSGGPTLVFAQAERNQMLGSAYQAALHNLLSLNTIPYTTHDKEAEYNQTGLLSSVPNTFVRAGGGYEQPWTRDASVNSWNAASLLEPAVARNTLLSVLRRESDGKLIVQQDNQWWDQVIWVSAAWHHYLVTGDRVFLAQAYEAARRTLDRNKEKHFNAKYGLYEGPAFLNDGIAGYPAPPADATETHGSFVLDYAGSERIMVLSTNCLYAEAYRVATLMGTELGRPAAETAVLRSSGATLASEIVAHLWMPAEGRFGYMLLPDGKLDHSQEGSGLAFSLLFGIASPEQRASILKATHIDPYGLVDVYPAFARFSLAQPGRHNKVVWPPIEAFWADAAARAGDVPTFARETETLASLAIRGDGHFWEIYNAQTGKPDGGWQAGHAWASEQNQTWSATGYLRLIFADLFGMRWEPTRLRFEPTLPAAWGEVTLSGLHYRGAVLTVQLRGHGRAIRSATLDGHPAPAELPASLQGAHALAIDLTETPGS